MAYNLPSITHLTSSPTTLSSTAHHPFLVLATLTSLYARHFKTFALAVPAAWNTLPPDILQITPSSTFGLSLILLMRPMMTSYKIKRKSDNCTNMCILVRIVILLKMKSWQYWKAYLLAYVYGYLNPAKESHLGMDVNI